MQADEIGFLIQNVKTLEPLKIEKWMTHSIKVLVKLFS